MNESFVFRFDQELEPIIFGGELNLTGWLVQLEGRPIHGIRVVIGRGIFRQRSKSARRKRRRPEVAAAFPHLPDAWSSGFLFELRLGLGRSGLTFQALDHEQRWQTFHTASVFCYPLGFLSRLPNTKRLLVAVLRRRFLRPPAAKKDASALSANDRSAASALPRRIDLFATSKSNLFILEIGELVAAGFRELGCDAQLHLDTLPSTQPAPDALQIVVTPHEFYNLFLADTISATETLQLTRHVHFLCTEQPATHWFETNLHWAFHSLGVADINPLGVAAYRARGLPALQLPLGYHPLLQQGGSERPHPARRHDLTFLGSLTPRREEFFAQHADFFAQHSCHLRFVPLGFAKTQETRSYLGAEKRNDLLSDSRILLNLHYSGQKYFEWHRMLLGLANGCCIISETSAGHAQLVPGKHFVMVEPEDLREACQYFLAHPAECEAIARAGQDFVRTHLRQAQTCAAYLEQLCRGEKGLRAFDLSPDQPPAPLAENLSRVIAQGHRHSLGAAVRKDFQNLFRRDEEEIADKADKLSSAERDRERGSVIVTREAYRSRFLLQEEARARGDSAWQFHDNDAYHEAGPPQLTVLVTLYNYAHHIAECMASITAAAANLAQAPEVVIVNDASTDRSLARALDLQAQSKLPMRIVDKKFNTGLADARNVGTQIARAPYVFMMDADNLLFSDALRQLFAAITAGNYIAAYSMLCRFRGNTANRVGLLSHFDFDPQILVQGPYVDAMAMFRRETLLELGGYDNELNQIGWFGWEDYEMWLRIAQRGDAVAFVPNTLCLYRHHRTSMINTTNLFELELVHCFLERYGKMLARFEPRATVFGVKREKLAAETLPAVKTEDDLSAKNLELHQP